jgi:transposase
MATERVHIGVDVSKDTLDVFIPGGKALSVRNTPAAVRRVVRGISAREPSAMFCCESTGGYERTLMDVCREEGRPFCLMNALQVRRYAEHRGLLEKTDKIDARVISMAADDKKPAPLVHPSEVQRRLRELWTLRTCLSAARDAERNRLEHLSEKEAAAAVRKIIAAYERQIAELERLCREAVAQDKDVESLLGRLQLVKGVGPLTALALIALLPELLVLDDKKLAKLAGVAPMCDQSGKLDGPRHIQKGRSLVRRALYWAAISASQHNVILSAVYDRLVKAGKAKKVALVALMRKLLCLMRRIAQDPGFVPAQG